MKQLKSGFVFYLVMNKKIYQTIFQGTTMKQETNNGNQNPSSLDYHIQQVINGNRRFENAFQAVSRMILESHEKIKKITVNGRSTYDFSIFRQGKKHIIGMYDEINSFVSFVKDAAEGGSSSEMAFVLIGEPGNGKTFFVDFLNKLYRDFITQPDNKRYTFRFRNLDKLGGYGKITFADSQTFEDPMILAMNLSDEREKNIEYIQSLGATDQQIMQWFNQYRSLGACTDYIYREILRYCDGDIDKAKEFIEVFPQPVNETSGNLTGKYAAKDKITSSAVDLLGEESITRLLHISDTHNPYRFDLRRGALARVAGGGIHFADEIFKNKRDLIQVYLGVIQNRTIEIEGFKWPIDTLIIATSNNAEFAKFLEEKEQAPIVDRCRLSYMAHNTNYKLQKELTAFAIGSREKTTFIGEHMHIDPNLNYAISASVVLSRMPHSDKLTPIEMMKLAAGDVAGEKSIKTLVEVINDLNNDPDITHRFGQKGLGHRNLGRAVQVLLERSETQEGKCMYAGDVFNTIESVVLDYIQEPNDRIKYLMTSKSQEDCTERM